MASLLSASFKLIVSFCACFVQHDLFFLKGKFFYTAFTHLIKCLSKKENEDVECGVFPLECNLKGIIDDTLERGICSEDVISRDLYDTKFMGVLTPPPRQIRSKFAELYQCDAKKATDWFYKFSQDTDYIRRYRIQKHAKWVSELKEKYIFTQENTANILKVEIGTCFEKVLEHAGVYKKDEKGQEAFQRFIDYVNKREF